MGFIVGCNRVLLHRLCLRLGWVLALGLAGTGCSAGEDTAADEAAKKSSKAEEVVAQQTSNPHDMTPKNEQSKVSPPHDHNHRHLHESENTAEGVAPSSTRFIEGQHYKKLTGVPKYEATEQVPVAEFFSYGCPHCFKMERILQEWHGSIPASIHFERVPAYWNPSFELLAKAYYTMVVLGVEDSVHDRIFETIHVRRQNLGSKAAIKQVFVDAGVSGDDFDKTFESFAVQQKMKMASQLFKTFGLKHVPVFVVGGQYVTDVSMAGSRKAVPEVIEYLARKIKVSEKK